MHIVREMILVHLPDAQVGRGAVEHGDRRVGIIVKIKNPADAAAELFCGDEIQRGDRHALEAVERALVLPARVVARRAGIVGGIARVPENHRTCRRTACQQ